MYHFSMVFVTNKYFLYEWNYSPFFLYEKRFPWSIHDRYRKNVRIFISVAPIFGLYKILLKPDNGTSIRSRPVIGILFIAEKTCTDSWQRICWIFLIKLKSRLCKYWVMVQFMGYVFESSVAVSRSRTMNPPHPQCKK